MELTWAPDFDNQGNVSQLAWMCEGCNEPLRLDDCVAAADFEISNEYLEQIGNCPDHRAVSPMFRVHRASGRLSVQIYFRCGCRPNLVWTEEDIQSFLDDLDEALPRDRSGRRSVRRVDRRAPPSVAPSGAATLVQHEQATGQDPGGEPPAQQEQEEAPPTPLQLAHLLPPFVVRSEMFSSVLVPLLLDAAGLLSPAAHRAWVEDMRSAEWWETSVENLRHGEELVELENIESLAWHSEYLHVHFRGEHLSEGSPELLRSWRLDAQRRHSTQISLRTALEIVLRSSQARSGYRIDDLQHNYLPGELQETFLLAFGSHELAVAVNQHINSFRSPLPQRNVAQPAPQPAPPSAPRTSVRDSGQAAAGSEGAHTSVRDSGNDATVRPATGSPRPAESRHSSAPAPNSPGAPSRRGQRRPAPEAGRSPRRRLAAPERPPGSSQRRIVASRAQTAALPSSRRREHSPRWFAEPPAEEPAAALSLV